MGYDTYTTNEQNILKNSNHCLNKFYSKVFNNNYDVGKCEEGLLLDSSKTTGIECGYFLFNAKINSEKSLEYKTCYLFNLDFYSSMTKVEPKTFDELVGLIIKSLGYSSYESFNVEFYDINGKNYI